MGAPMAGVVLHQWEISPFCGKVRRILERKSIPYETVNYNGMKSLAVGKLSPVGKLPVLDYDGERIQDSTRIAAFLDDHHPDPALLPEDPHERAMALLLEDWADESLYWYEVYFRSMDPVAFERAVDLMCEGRPGYERPFLRLGFKRTILRQCIGQGLGRMPREQVEASFWSLLDGLETLLDSHDWLVGTHETIADIAASSQLDEILRTSPLREKVLAYHNIAAWLDRGRNGPGPHTC